MQNINRNILAHARDTGGSNQGWGAKGVEIITGVVAVVASAGAALSAVGAMSATGIAGVGSFTAISSPPALVGHAAGIVVNQRKRR